MPEDRSFRNSAGVDKQWPASELTDIKICRAQHRRSFGCEIVGEQAWLHDRNLEAELILIFMNAQCAQLLQRPLLKTCRTTSSPRRALSMLEIAQDYLWIEN